GPDAWRVTGVADDDVLNARMGPGTDYSVITTFGPRARGLQLVTCVPLVTQSAWFDMTPEQRQALPQRWCLMRSQDASRAGWVAQRYLAEDSAAAETAASRSAQEEPVASSSVSCPRTHVAALGSMRAQKAPMEVARRDAERFLRADGFTPLDRRRDSSSANSEGFYSAARFPDIDDSALMPDARLAAVTRAMLQFDFEEGIIQHPRYRITYHVRHTPPGEQCDVIESAYIQITRFNLGPERYNEVIQSVDETLWPPRELFGTQPHVSWRLVSIPAKYRGYATWQVSRRLLSDEEARVADCLGEPCLSLEASAGPTASQHSVPVEAWQPRQPRDHEPANYREPGYSWAPGPARVADLLYLEATGSYRNLDPSEGSSLERPEITMVISRDVLGQESNTAGLLRRGGLMDHIAAEEWLRMWAMPDPMLGWEQRDVHWRHPH
ncbi:MAG TPA: hypothetical protein VK965_06595, partial [Halomonas sp.]|nr:hypothetical protein [Halomonas sp.]